MLSWRRMVVVKLEMIGEFRDDDEENERCDNVDENGRNEEDSVEEGSEWSPFYDRGGVFVPVIFFFVLQTRLLQTLSKKNRQLNS